MPKRQPKGGIDLFYNEALATADEHEDVASAYFIAQEQERQKNWSAAILFYSKSKCFGNAIRIAKKYGLDKDLLRLSLQSSNIQMNDIAKYLELKGEYKNAIILYQKAENYEKAVKLCQTTKNFDLLEDLSSKMDPIKHFKQLSRAAKSLESGGHHQSALKILLAAKKIDEALELCTSKDIHITEALHGDLCLSLTADSGRDIFMRIGKICYLQQEYTLACKSFTLVGTPNFRVAIE